MEIQQEDTKEQNKKNECREMYDYYHPAAGRVLAGLVLVGVGVVLFMEKMGYFFPSWIFTWKAGLIALGIFIGARRLFRGLGWLIPVVIGLLFLADDLIPGFEIRPYIWPVVIALIGLVMIFRPKRRMYSWHHKWRHKDHRFYRKYKWQDENQEAATSDEDRLDAVVVFGSTKKNVISKNFKGGEVTCVFGGAEINLSQADFNGKVVLEMNQVFGGTKLILPPHWQIHYQETVTFLGGIEDKRPKTNSADPNKTLILKGTSVFGGIEIDSY